MKKQKKTFYVVTIGDIELPVFCGCKEDVMRFLDIKKFKTGKHGLFKVEKVDAIPDEFLLCELMCPVPEEY